MGQMCETNPIPGGAGWDEATGAWDVGQSRKTNPIFRLRISDWGLGTDLRRNAYPAACRLRPAQADCAKRTQFRPSAREWARAAGAAEAKCAKRTQFPALPGGARPEGRGTRGKCAKRTQFAARHVARASRSRGSGRACPSVRIMRGTATPNAKKCIWEPTPVPLFRQPGANRAKRTQFPAGPGGTRPQGRGTRGNRAKRSQFWKEF